MAEFLFFNVGTALWIFFFSIENKNVKNKIQCALCAVGYKNCDLKTTRQWRAEQKEIQGFFAFSAKIWIYFCGDLCGGFV